MRAEVRNQAPVVVQNWLTLSRHKPIQLQRDWWLFPVLDDKQHSLFAATMTQLELADTALKIGLGSLITILGSVVLAKLNQSHEHRKDILRRKHDSIEQITAEFSQIHSFLLENNALHLKSVRALQSPNEIDAYTKILMARFVEIVPNLPQQGIKLQALRTRLLLFRMHSAASIIGEYFVILNKLQHAASKLVPESPTLLQDGDAVMTAFDELDRKYCSFLDALAKHYCN